MAYICSFSTQEAELEAYGEFEDNFSCGEFEARRGKTAGDVTVQYSITSSQGVRELCGRRAGLSG